MSILAIEDMKHVDALEYTKVTNQRFVQIRKAPKTRQPTESPESDNFSSMARH